jgi:hypothetical protein
VAHFWQRFLATGVLDRSTPVPETVEPFGDSMELADKLIAAAQPELVEPDGIAQLTLLRDIPDPYIHS